MSSPLKALRLKRSQTLQVVATAVGTDAGNISRIENGKQKASPAMAERLAKHFGYAITEIQILYPERFVEKVGASDTVSA
jgi:transcriptional regulator with XRE-family HTH domain